MDRHPLHRLYLGIAESGAAPVPARGNLHPLPKVFLGSTGR